MRKYGTWSVLDRTSSFGKTNRRGDGPASAELIENLLGVLRLTTGKHIPRPDAVHYRFCAVETEMSNPFLSVSIDNIFLLDPLLPAIFEVEQPLNAKGAVEP